MSLTQQQINEAGEAMNDGLRNGVISAELRDSLVTDLRSPTVGNAELVAGARKVRADSRTNPAYLGGLDAYIEILTGAQQPATPVPTAPAAPSTPPAAPAPVVSSATTPGAALLPANRPVGTVNRNPGVTARIATIAELTLPVDRTFEGNTRINGKLSVNMDPLDVDASVQIGGSGTAEVLLVSNLAGQDKQNPTHPHIGTFHLANDNGMGMGQNVAWRNGVPIRTDPTRKVTYVHLDSLGDLSLSRGEYGPNDEWSQQIVLKYSEVRRMWVLGIAAAGVGFAVRGSVSTNDFGDVDDPNPARGEVVVIAALPL